MPLGGGGAATQTFAPGGKYPRAATGFMQLFVIDLIFYKSFILSWVTRNEKLEITLAYYIYN